mgnify:CR=1 FL=1
MAHTRSRAPITVTSLILLAVAAWPAAGSAQTGGDPVESVYLSLGIDDCHTIETFDYNMGGVVDCGTAAGYEVHLVDHDLRQRLVLRANGQAFDVDPDVPNFNWLGPLAEFRGRQTADGFAAHALIVRVHLDDGTGTGREIQRLLVTALGNDGACRLGWIDAVGNPDHNQDARDLADSAVGQGCAATGETAPAAKG